MLHSFGITNLAIRVGGLPLPIPVLSPARILSQETWSSAHHRGCEVQRTRQRIGVIASEVPVGIEA
jgi:hypothetical protein